MKLIARLIAFGVNAKKKKRRKEDQGKTKQGDNHGKMWLYAGFDSCSAGFSLRDIKCVSAGAPHRSSIA
jgi:hypothetical protein